jgi:hypothetical protein
MGTSPALTIPMTRAFLSIPQRRRAFEARADALRKGMAGGTGSRQGRP